MGKDPDMGGIWTLGPGSGNGSNIDTGTHGQDPDVDRT
jgi:hypothetical protein